MAQDYHSEEEILGKAYDSHLMKRLLAYIKPYRKYVIFAILMNIIVAALGPLRPYLTKVAIDLAYVQNRHAIWYDELMRNRVQEEDIVAEMEEEKVKVKADYNKLNPVCQSFVPGSNTIFPYLLHTIPRTKNTL